MSNNEKWENTFLTKKEKEEKTKLLIHNNPKLSKLLNEKDYLDFLSKSNAIKLLGEDNYRQEVEKLFKQSEAFILDENGNPRLKDEFFNKKAQEELERHFENVATRVKLNNQANRISDDHKTKIDEKIELIEEKQNNTIANNPIIFLLGGFIYKIILAYQKKEMENQKEDILDKQLEKIEHLSSQANNVKVTKLGTNVTHENIMYVEEKRRQEMAKKEEIDKRYASIKEAMKELTSKDLENLKSNLPQPNINIQDLEVTSNPNIKEEGLLKNITRHLNENINDKGNTVKEIIGNVTDKIQNAGKNFANHVNKLTEGTPLHPAQVENENKPDNKKSSEPNTTHSTSISQQDPHLASINSKTAEIYYKKSIEKEQKTNISLNEEQKESENQSTSTNSPVLNDSLKISQKLINHQNFIGNQVNPALNKSHLEEKKKKMGIELVSKIQGL